MAVVAKCAPATRLMAVQPTAAHAAPTTHQACQSARRNLLARSRHRSCSGDGTCRERGCRAQGRQGSEAVPDLVQTYHTQTNSRACWVGMGHRHPPGDSHHHIWRPFCKQRPATVA